MEIDNVYVQSLFQQSLQPDEGILWVGRPNRWKLLSTEDIALIPFSILWFGFACFWVIGVWTEPSHDPNAASRFAALFGLPFILIGLYMVIGRFIYKFWEKSHTYYALTNQRAIIIRTGLSNNFTAVCLHILPTLNLQVRRDGSGTIIFGERTTEPSFPLGRRHLYRRSESPEFNDIPAVQQVYALIEQQRRS